MDEKMRILIIEDEESSRRTLELILNKSGYEVERAETGQEALAKASENKFNLALLDIKLPDIEGIDLIKPLQKTNPDMEVIMVTGYASVESAVLSLKMGASNYITKPLDMDKMLVEVKNVFNTQRLVFEKRRAEKEQRESEERYHNIFDATAVSIIEEDFSAVYTAVEELKNQGVQDFRNYLDEHPEFVHHVVEMIIIKDVNNAALKLFGAESKEELFGSLDKIILRESLNVLKDELVAIAEGRSFFEGESTIQTLQEKKINVLLSMKIPSEPAKLDSVLVSMMDITNRKRVEKSLKESEERFRDIALSTSDWVWEIDTQDCFTYCSERVIDVLGHAQDEVIGKTPFDFMPPDEAKRVGKIFAEISRKHEPLIDLENWNIKQGGELICLLTNAIPVFDEDDHFKGYRGVDKDITERKKTEEELKNHRENLEDLVSERTERLDKMVQMMAGRENRMAELKNMMRTLHAQLKEAGLKPLVDDPILEDRKGE